MITIPITSFQLVYLTSDLHLLLHQLAQPRLALALAPHHLRLQPVQLLSLLLPLYLYLSYLLLVRYDLTLHGCDVGLIASELAYQHLVGLFGRLQF